MQTVSQNNVFAFDDEFLHEESTNANMSKVRVGFKGIQVLFYVDKNRLNDEKHCGILFE
jgi:hypothetical protein